MANLESQMEDILKETPRYPTGFRDPSIIDPITSQPYDDSSRMRQQDEITRQADAKEELQSDENRVKLPKLLEEKITPLFNKPEIDFSAQELEEQYKDYNPQFGKADELDEYGMKRYVADRSSILTESNLNKYYTSLIDTIVDAGFLLRNEAQGVTNEKSLLSNFNKTEDRDAVIGFLKEALGPGPYGEGFDINTASWCAAFVNHILGIAGFDQLKYGPTESEERYNKIRANAYLNYGTPVDGLENAKEGDLIIWDLEPDNSNVGTHVTFYAGDRYGKQGVGDSVDVVGGNHGLGKVSLKGSGSKDVYVKKNIRGIVRVTKNNITQEFVNKLADIDPIFKPFKDDKGLAVSLRPQLRPKNLNEGGLVTDLERGETEKALGLPPRSTHFRFDPYADIQFSQQRPKTLFNRQEAQAQEGRKQPPLDELNYGKPIVSYKKTTNSPTGQDKIADISSLSRLNPPLPQGEKESLNVGPFTYNPSGRNSITGKAFVEKRSEPEKTYPDGAVVTKEGKTVGLAVNGRLLFNKEGDDFFTAGFNRIEDKNKQNVELPTGKLLHLEDGTTVKSYEMGAGFGRFIFDARKGTSTKGKDSYSGKVTYLLGDNADISIQDSTGGETTLGFNFRKSFSHGGLTGHPSAMTADEYYDAESKKGPRKDQTEDSLGLSSQPFFERPLDADVTDKQVGGFGEGETPIFRTILGNTYTVSLNPDQRTFRTKFKEDVVPAIKKFADDPRLPTKDELVGAGTAVAKGAYDTFSTPKRLFTGEQSPTETQMGDVFDIAGGTALGASAMKAPKGAIRSFAGREGDPGGPTYKDRTGPYIDRQVTPSFNPYATVSKKKLGELYNNFNDVIDSDPDYPDPNATPKALEVLSDTPLRDVISIFKKVYNTDGTRKLSDSEEDTLVKRYLALSKQFASRYPSSVNPNVSPSYKIMSNSPHSEVLKNSSELLKFYLSLMKSVRDDQEQMFFDNPFTDAGSNDPKSEIFKYNVKDVESEFPVEGRGIDIAGGLDNLPTHLQQAVIGGRSSGRLGLSQSQTVKFRKPIIEVVNTIKMKPMKIQGETFDTMLGRDFLTALQKSPAIGKDSYSQILIDPDQRYTRDDLRKIVSSDEYNVNGIDFGSGYKNTQRQYLVGFAGGKEVGYFEMPILTTTPEKGRLPYSPKPTTVRMGSAHFANEDIAHFRGSIIDPEGMLDSGINLKQEYLDTFNYLVDGKKYLLIEEIQTDILQKGHLRDETELPKKNFKMFLQEVDSQEIDTPTKDRYDIAKKFGFDTEELFAKAEQEGVINLDPFEPIANFEKRAIRDDIIKKYKKAKLEYSKSTLVPMALDQKFPTLAQLNSDYNFYEMLARQLPDDSKRVVKPPISSSKNYKQVTDEVLKAAISKAVQSGASRIVIPSVSRMAVLRGIDKENPPKVFSSLYDKDLKKTLMELKENYPSVNINYDVVLPYRNDTDLASFDPVNDDPVDFKLGDPKGIVIDLSALMQEKELRYPRQFGRATGGLVFNKGGLTSMDEQMQMAMSGEAETRDPVSGNDVPPGSLPEEVRDDIDAKLSEGEYVVPADVVRFFGVKFFEDLRMEAKQGLQQMDADGRIGGEPVPPEDSMDVAELKAELSESGMYAGGLTDGGSLDTFIDDASRSPMVNGRMRASGASVKMAVGGLAIGNYGDVTKVDGIIQKLMTAANKDPALMDKLTSKGIMVNKTGADMKSAEMQQANKPQEPTDPIKMQEGGLMDTVPKTNPFLQRFSTVGGTAFEPMLEDFEDMSDEDKAALEAFTDPSGVIKEVFLVDAEGNRFTVAWNTAMPVPEGFTLEEIPEGFNATEPVYPAGTVINPAVQTKRKIEDDGPSVPYVSTRTSRSGSGISSEGMGDNLSSGLLMGVNTDYENMSLTELKKAEKALSKKAQNTNLIGFVTSMLLKSNPASAVISLITTGTKIAAERKRKDIANAALKKYGELKIKEETEYPNLTWEQEQSDEYKKIEKGLSSYEDIYNSALRFEDFDDEGKMDTSVLNRAINTFTGREGDSLFSGTGKERFKHIDDIWKDHVPNAPVGSSTKDRPDSITVPEQISDDQDQTAKGKGIRGAARFAAQRSAAKFAEQKRQQQRNLGYDLSGKSDQGRGYVDSFKDNPNYIVQGNTVYSKEKDGTRGGAVGGVTEHDGTYGSTKSYRDAVDAKNKANEDRYEQARSDFFSNIFNEGGLVAKPAAIKQKKKKRKTQRRKGLGTRP